MKQSFSNLFQYPANNKKISQLNFLIFKLCMK